MDYLGSIKKGRLEEPIRAVIYGKDGVGKTGLASEAPKTIFICAEQGTAQYDVARFPQPDKFSDILQMVNWLLEKDRGYETLTIDTIDWLEPMLHKQCEEELGKPLSKIGYNKGYDYALDKTRQFINLVSKLKTMNILCLAHARIRTFQDPATGSGYDRYQMAMRDDTANVWRQWATDVLFLDYKVVKADSEDRFAVGDGERIIYTEERPSHQAKNRHNLPYMLPLKKGSSWKAFYDAVKAGGVSPDVLYKEVKDLLNWVEDPDKRLATATYVDQISTNLVALTELKSKLMALANGRV